MDSVQESLYPLKEEYAAEKIDHVLVEKDCISIYLEDGKFIEVRAKMEICEQGIKPVLKIDRAFWGRLPLDKK